MSGKIKVTGYGTIKIKVTDDNGKKHDLIIHNVLYVPQSPINLISPQKWSQGMHDNGTGEITVGDATLLFWDNHKFTKLIPHQPDYGIPIMSVNDGFTKSNAFFNATKEFSSMYCHPCSTTHSYLNTSQQVKTDKGTHIVPLLKT